MSKLKSKLKERGEKAKKLGEKKEITSTELFTPDFIRQHTKFNSWDEMCQAGGIKSEEELMSDEFSSFVADNSDFASLAEMWQKAGKEFMARQVFS